MHIMLRYIYLNIRLNFCMFDWSGKKGDKSGGGGGGSQGIFISCVSGNPEWANEKGLSCKAPISLAWRPVGDLLATRVSVGRGDIAATSPGDLAGREGVAVKSNMFDFFCDS